MKNTKKKSIPKRVSSDRLGEKKVESITEDTAFLIPTAHHDTDTLTFKRQDSQTMMAPQRLLKLRPVSSRFYHLPIVHPSQPISINPYISFKATFPPSTEANEPSSDLSPPSLDSEERTVFLINLPRSVSPDSLARLFAHTLHVSPSSVEVSIHDPRFNQHLLPCSEFNLFQRDFQIYNSTLSDSNPKDSQNNAQNNHTLNDTNSNNNKKEKKIIKLFESPVEDKVLMGRLWSKGSTPGAHIRFESSTQVTELKNLTDLPLRWPKKESQEDSEGWIKIYETRRRVSRITTERAHDYADLWMHAWEAGRLPSLPKDKDDEIDDNLEVSIEDEQVQQDGDDSEDGAAWTVVKRGGHHGRSATLPTQTNKNKNNSRAPQKRRGADPYAQSSMADRDQHAAAKVMHKKFAKQFLNSSTSTTTTTTTTTTSSSSKRKSSDHHLNPDFYKPTSSMLNNNKKIRLNQIRENFNQIKMKIQPKKSN